VSIKVKNMVSVKLCDKCYSEGKMVESKYRVGFKGDLKLDLCEKCSPLAPKSKQEFIKFYYKVIMNEEPTDDQVANIMKFR